MFNQYSREVNSLLREIISLIYYMRGAIQYEEMMNRSYAERRLFSEFIEARLLKESKNPYPVY